MFPDAERECDFFFLSFFSHEEIRRDCIFPSFPFHLGRGVVYFGMRRCWLRGAKRESGVILQVNESVIAWPYFLHLHLIDLRGKKIYLREIQGVSIFALWCIPFLCLEAM